MNRILLVVFALAALAPAQTFTTLYNFTGGTDGSNPDAGVIQDDAGSLYGTTPNGGSGNLGVVYKLNTAVTETVLHAFSRSDGGNPISPVVRTKSGTIYGTTFSGYTSGTVYKIDTAGNLTVLYAFTGSWDGCNPAQGLVRNKTGSLYGTTFLCGGPEGGGGTLFRLYSAGEDFTVLHKFTGYPSDGSGPNIGHPTMDKTGNIYGVTTYGGDGGCPKGCGALYELRKTGTYTLLHSFAGGTSDGCYPSGTVVKDKSGNIYGTSSECGSNSYSTGTLWKVSKKGKETILHNFEGASDGDYPYAGLVRDSKGNLYGVASAGGAYGYGTLYEFNTGGELIILHSFSSSDGAGPYGEVLRTAKGTLYGTTSTGGTYGYGTVWKYVP